MVQQARLCMSPMMLPVGVDGEGGTRSFWGKQCARDQDSGLASFDCIAHSC